MSTRITASARMNAACQQLLRERLSLPAGAALEFGNLHAVLATGQADLSSLQELIWARPVSTALSTLTPGLFGQVNSLLNSTSLAGDLPVIASSVQQGITSALAEAEAAIATAVRDATAEAFAEAGAELGYTVSVCRGPEATGLEMRRDHEILLLRIADGGAVESDHAGLAGAACGDRQRDLEHAAARRGITLTGRQQEDHGSAQGGTLIRLAAARRDPSLARAAALAAVRPGSGAPARARSRAENAVEPERRRRAAGPR